MLSSGIAGLSKVLLEKIEKYTSHFSKMLNQTILLLPRNKNSFFIFFLPHIYLTWYFWVLIWAILTGRKWQLSVILIYISPIISDNEHEHCFLSLPIGHFRLSQKFFIFSSPQFLLELLMVSFESAFLFILFWFGATSSDSKVTLTLHSGITPAGDWGT